MTEAFPVTTGLKVLKRYVYADVTLGYLSDQGRVTTQVRASMDDPEVAEAMKPVLDLLAKRAHSVVRDADLREQIEAGIREEIKLAAEDERSRIQRNNSRQLEEVVGELGRTVDRLGVDSYERRMTEKARDAVRGLTTGRE